MTTVALVEDHRLFSSALAVALQRVGVTVIEPPCTSLDEMRQYLMAARPDVLLLDLDLGRLGNGEELVGPMARSGTAVVVVSATVDDVVIGRCLDRGATGFVSKRFPFDVLLSTVLAATSRETVLPAAERQRLIDAWRRADEATRASHAPFDRLTQREAFVLGELMQGCTVEEIASNEFVAQGTVRSHVRGILTKLGVRSQLQAVALASGTDWRPPGAEDPPNGRRSIRRRGRPSPAATASPAD
jgi:two-component system, NarL family, nitrate/nitrite response regulator NarL